MKLYKQFSTCLNKVLQLKLLQIVAICHNTIAWANFFIKMILHQRETLFFNKEQIKNSSLGRNKN